MPTDPPLVADPALTSSVLRLVAETLVIAPDRVRLESKLSEDLGAESIDFLDLVFRLEDSLRIPVSERRWQRFLAERESRQPQKSPITAATVLEFAELALREAGHGADGTGSPYDLGAG